MSNQAGKTAVLIVGHGSPRPAANAGFLGLVGRIAARLGATSGAEDGPAHGPARDPAAATVQCGTAALGCESGLIVLPAFFSIARPSIEDRVAELVARGVSRIVLLPYFLFRGQHVTRDIPALLDQCRQAHPGLTLELLATLENEPALEDVVVERVVAAVGEEQPLPADGPGIEQRSMQIIDAYLAGLRTGGPAVSGGQESSSPWGEGRGEGNCGEQAVVRRVIHATADFSFARSLRIHPAAVACGLKALADGRPIICDVKMLATGITRVSNEVICAISDPQVIQMAKDRNCTRAAAAMDALADRLDGAIIAVGNAPTALWRLLEMTKVPGSPQPALVVGLPVGFVGASQAKRALMDSDLCYISNVGPRGGSPVAAAAINALAILGREGKCCNG